MNCDQAQPLIAAYADGELDALRRLFVEKHLRTCARCAEQHAELLGLRRRLRAEAPYFAAPSALTERVRAMVVSTPAARPARASRVPERWRRLSAAVPQRWQWVSGGALCGTRGEMTPLRGLSVGLRRAAAGPFQCSYSARFQDGTTVGPVRDGEMCRSTTLAPLEAIQVDIQPRAGQAK